MQTLQLGRYFSDLYRYLEGEGYQIEELTDYMAIGGLMDQIGKAYLTPMNSPTANDFTQKNVLWLVARKSGVPVMVGAARLEDLGDETVDEYWRRLFWRHHPEAKFRLNFPTVVSDMKGKLAYFGDMFVVQGHRGKANALRAFVALGHVAVSMKWDPDWTYCFVRERDVMRGSPSRFGFTRQMGVAFSWEGKPPEPRTGTEWLVGLPRGELAASISATIETLMASNNEG